VDAEQFCCFSLRQFRRTQCHCEFFHAGRLRRESFVVNRYKSSCAICKKTLHFGHPNRRPFP
jgi:hypothetical protein